MTRYYKNYDYWILRSLSQSISEVRMRRCITCIRWALGDYGMGSCRINNKFTQPGEHCASHKSTVSPILPWQRYLVALIGRERAELGTPAHDLFCNDVDKFYHRLDPTQQIRTHDAFRLFLENPNFVERTKV